MSSQRAMFAKFTNSASPDDDDDDEDGSLSVCLINDLPLLTLT